MSESTSGPSVTVNYLELPGGTLAESKRFYTEAFGWSWTDYGPDYAAYEEGGVTVGLNPAAEAAPAPGNGSENGLGPLALFETDDLQAALAAVRAASGTITSEPYDYPGGRRFHFRDPAGNTIGIYQSAPLP